MAILKTTKRGDNLLHPSKFRCLHCRSPSPADPISGAYQTVSTVVNETVYSCRCIRVALVDVARCQPAWLKDALITCLGLAKGLEVLLSTPRETSLRICVACQHDKISGSYLTVSTVVDINVHSCCRQKCSLLRTFVPGFVRTWPAAQATRQNQRVTVRDDAAGGRRKFMVRSQRGVPCGGVGDKGGNHGS